MTSKSTALARLRKEHFDVDKGLATHYGWYFSFFVMGVSFFFVDMTFGGLCTILAVGAIGFGIAGMTSTLAHEYLEQRYLAEIDGTTQVKIPSRELAVRVVGSSAKSGTKQRKEGDKLD